MSRRSNKTKKASIKRRRFTRKQRGSGFFFNRIVSSVAAVADVAKKLTKEMKPVAAASPAPKPVVATASPAPKPVAAAPAASPAQSAPTLDKNNPIIKVLIKVKEVVKNYITDKSSFCDNTSILSKGLSLITGSAPKFKSAEKIFDGLLQFLYNNRQTYVDAVFQLKKQFGINTEIDILRPFLGRFPIPFAVTMIKKVFFAEPGHLSGIYASINTVIRDPAVAPFCTTQKTDLIAFAKKLIRQIADKMKLPMKIKNALASESW